MDKPLPVSTPTARPFWEGLREEKVVIQYSPSTDAWVYYPRLLAPGTLADDLEWREVTGRGVVYASTVCHKPTAPAWVDDVPQVLAIVELDEGPRVPTELVDVDPEEVRIGMLVKPYFHHVDGEDVTLLKFTAV